MPMIQSRTFMVIPRWLVDGMTLAQPGTAGRRRRQSICVAYARDSCSSVTYHDSMRMTGSSDTRSRIASSVAV